MVGSRAMVVVVAELLPLPTSTVARRAAVTAVVDAHQQHRPRNNILLTRLPTTILGTDGDLHQVHRHTHPPATPVCATRVALVPLLTHHRLIPVAVKTTPALLHRTLALEDESHQTLTLQHHLKVDLTTTGRLCHLKYPR
jgi:hypothetical protein